MTMRLFSNYMSRKRSGAVKYPFKQLRMPPVYARYVETGKLFYEQAPPEVLSGESESQVLA